MSITRSEVLRRARTGWPMGQVPYSQSGLRADGYRPDCSGFATMALGIPPRAFGDWGGLSTITFVTAGVVYGIPISDLKPGDLIGRMGEGTGGDLGHVQVFVSWDNHNPDDNGHTVIEQTGGSRGPHETHYDHWRQSYRAYRYKGIVDDPAPLRPFPLHFPPHVYGPIDGDEWSHGGYYAAERPVVGEIQRALIRAGVVPGITDPWSTWADGRYESPTVDAVATFQRRHGCTVDGQVGPQTWEALLPFMG